MTKTPYNLKLGNTKNLSFPSQFNGTIDARSLGSTPIEYLDMQGAPMGGQHATGFFLRVGGRVFLVSARHSLTGLDPFTNDVLDEKTGYLPQRIRAYPYLRRSPLGHRLPGGIELTVRSEDGSPRWWQDPEFNELRTDIACVEVTHACVAETMCVNETPDVDDLLANVGLDCFVVGYPNRNYCDPYIAIWRRASFAYEPTMPVDDKPLFLLDGMTSRGMSGAAIFQRWHGPAPVLGKDGSITMHLKNVVASRLVGVYGGRTDNVQELGQIGYGWYANRIPLILASAVAVAPLKSA